MDKLFNIFKKREEVVEEADNGMPKFTGEVIEVNFDDIGVNGEMPSL